MGRKTPQGRTGKLVRPLTHRITNRFTLKEGLKLTTANLVVSNCSTEFDQTKGLKNLSPRRQRIFRGHNLIHTCFRNSKTSNGFCIIQIKCTFISGMKKRTELYESYSMTLTPCREDFTVETPPRSPSPCIICRPYHHVNHCKYRLSAHFSAKFTDNKISSSEYSF